MKFLRLALVTGISACSTISKAAPQTVAESSVEAADPKIPELIRELADENFRAREDAMRKLWEVGDAALPLLQQAANGDDPEMSFRASELIRKIQLSITPETDPSIVALIERYSKASPNVKVTLLEQLAKKRAWRQILRLYSTEKNPDLRARIQESAKDGAVRAARECLLQGDVASARAFLEMAPADASGMLALADFHRSQGTLDAELKRAQSLKGRNSDAWQLALYRAAGNLEAARHSAVAADEPRIAAQLSMLLGDPLPWLRSMQARGDDEPVRKIYSSLAIRRWQGKEARSGELEPLIRLVASHNPEESRNALKVLFLLGEKNLAEEGLVKVDPFLAFAHFEALERVSDALRALNLDPANPDYRTWVGKRIGHLGKDDAADEEHGPSEDVAQLVAMANFLERRGLVNEANDAFLKPLEELARNDEAAFTDFLRSLFGNQDSSSGAPQLSKRVGMAWAGEDKNKWAELVIAAFGEEDEATAWWDWLTELDPEASLEARFDAMLALFDIGADPRRLRAKWLSLAWDAIEKAPEGKKPELVARIASISSQLLVKGGNVEQSLKAWDHLPPNSRSEMLLWRHIQDLSASGRWGEAADIFLKQVERVAELKQDVRPELYAYVAGCLRRTGRIGEAAKYDELVNKLVLGNAECAIKIGSGYAYSGDYERAREWWFRGIRECDPDSDEFAGGLPLITDYLLEEGRWSESAAIAEVLAQAYAAVDLIAPSILLRQRLQADMSRALARLPQDRPGAIAALEKCHRMFPSDGSLADYFFPSVRKAGLIEEHNKWFQITWEVMEEAIKNYPDSDNTYNTAAWLASRARLKLDQAEGYLKRALALNPEQSAYLDTMAEIQFAKGNRAKAMEWSQLAVNFEPQDVLLRRQHERFRSDPLPK
jgi:tetratricopeptide (TPR) repeat protein